MDDNSPPTIEGSTITESVAYPAVPPDNPPSADELSPILGAPPPTLPAAQPAASQPVAADPEFDAYMAVVKLIVGGAVEGAAELVKRLEKWESELTAAEAPPGPGEIKSSGDVVRYMLVGMALSTGDGVRRQVLKLAQASDLFWRFTGNAAQPLVNSRVTGVVTRPLDRALNRLVTRGQQRVDDWIALGRAQEPGARRIARKAYLETIDEFIGLLAENQELAALVQNQSVGLATEAVDEFRSRTVSADAIAENIVRRILRRPPRAELPAPSDEVRQTILDHNIQTAGRPQAGP
jgi:hypothetical protein